MMSTANCLLFEQEPRIVPGLPVPSCSEQTLRTSIACRNLRFAYSLAMTEVALEIGT